MTPPLVLASDGRHAAPPPTADRIAACLERVAAFHDRPIPRALFEEAARPGEADGGLAAGLRAAETGGYEVGLGPLQLDDLDAALFPAILLTETGALVVEGRDGADWAVYDPRLDTDAPTRVTDARLRAVLSGDGILIRPRADLDAEAPRPGHWFRSALAANKWSYVQVVLAAAVANILGLTTSIFIMVVYDRVLPNQATDSLIALTVGVAIALVFDFFIRTLRAGFIDRAGQRADVEMGGTIFDRAMSIRLAARQGSTGATASALREFDTLRDFFASASLVAIVDLPFILLFVGVIYLIGGPLAIVPLIAVPVVLIVALITQPMLARLADESFRDGQSKQAVLVEALSGLETIKAARAEGRMKARWDKALRRQAEHGVKSRALSQFALNATALTQQTAQIAIVVYGVSLIIAGSLSMGALIASVILTGKALAPLAQIAQTLTRISQTRTAYRAIDRIMQAESDRPHGRRYLSRDGFDGGISFHDVSFAYPEAGANSLTNVSMTLEPGERVAILGPIGSGKSTLARMILGLYTPAAGSVRLDGVDLRQIDPGDLRRNVGAALQDVWLFSGTLRENIAIGAPRARDSDILRAAEVAGVNDFARKHANGFDLAIAERGEGLSGGQRQAVALARALLNRPPVLVLDEPTSAMDVMTEAKVIDRLKDEVEGRTLVVVTHRKSLLDLVDRVIVMDDGRIVADGPKAEIVGGGKG